MAMILSNVPNPEKGKGAWATRKERIVPTAVCILAVILAIPLTMLTKEELGVLNGYLEYDTVALGDGDRVEAAFTPSFNEIRKIRFGLESMGGEGVCEISLWDADTLLYRDALPVQDFEGNLQGKEVKWKLQGGKTYRLDLQMKGITKPVQFYVTKNGETPLTEYGEMTLNDQKMVGQMLSGITYWTMPNSRYMKIFVAATWMGILLAVGSAIGRSGK